MVKHERLMKGSWETPGAHEGGSWKAFCCCLLYFEQLLILQKRWFMGDSWEAPGAHEGGMSCFTVRPWKRNLPLGQRPFLGQNLSTPLEKEPAPRAEAFSGAESKVLCFTVRP